MSRTTSTNRHFFVLGVVEVCNFDVYPTLARDSRFLFRAYEIGLYQINFVVPANARSGNLDVIVRQGSRISNTVEIVKGHMQGVLMAFGTTSAK